MKIDLKYLILMLYLMKNVFRNVTITISLQNELHGPAIIGGEKRDMGKERYRQKYVHKPA